MSLSNGVIGLFEDDGDLIERYEYTPYGVRTVYTSAGSNDWTCRSPIMESKRAVADGAPAPSSRPGAPSAKSFPCSVQTIGGRAVRGRVNIPVRH